MKIIIFLLLGLFVVSIFIIAVLPNSKTIYKYSSGYYCVPRQGIGYFESNQVPTGAILVKPNPDVTNGIYTQSLDVNFFKMVGCVR
jgi:hypothetical protein